MYYLNGHFINGSEYRDNFCNPVQLRAKMKRIARNEAAINPDSVTDEDGNIVGTLDVSEETGAETWTPAKNCPDWITEELRPRMYWE